MWCFLERAVYKIGVPGKYVAYFNGAYNDTKNNEIMGESMSKSFKIRNELTH